MSKKGKIIIFILIVFIGVASIIYNLNDNINENIYVVSQNEEIKKDSNIEDLEYEKSNNITKKSITIFISGEVNNPGVVTIEGDKRLSDAVEQLGGATVDADLNKINLAMKIEDEKHYIIPKKGEILDINIEGGGSIDSNNSKININSASIDELDTLPGVGEATANKIVSYRDENGKFKSIEEIKNVNGIGDKKFLELKDKIIVE
ncbi:MAG: helix-hairpin-helix domain-containing protein [Peptostreptococcaceae bacterium]